MESWGRFTVRGGDEVESSITSLVSEVGRIVEETVPPSDYKALILLGGYGRGEGGVVVRDGQEQPHNNLDFLLILEDPAAETRIRESVAPRWSALEKARGIGLDLGCVSVRTLQHSPCLVMWYDMRFGHKTVLGDSDFLPSLKQFSVDRILPGDVLWLLVNRGSHVLINDYLMAQRAPREEDKRVIVKHAVKAIIGYGDALLFFLGAYNWSYQEKARRMAERTDVPESFRNLYAEAIAFRFAPCYEEYLGRDMHAWMDSLRDAFQPVHIECESRRLGRTNWTWAEYPSLNLRYALLSQGSSPRATARKALNCLRGPKPPSQIGLLDKMAYRAAGYRGLLPACFPAIMYGLEEDSTRNWVKHALGSHGTSQKELLRTYLRAWGHYADANFFKVAQQLDLPLETEEPVS